METKTITVSGMHCPSCEVLMREDLGDIDGVKSVEADHKAGIAKIGYEGSLNMDEVKRVVKELGFEVKGAKD